MAPAGIKDRSIVTIQVMANGDSSNPMRVPIVKAAPQILAVANLDGSAVTAAHPATIGGIVTLYLAGIGDGASLPGMEFDVGEDSAEVLYAGPAPGQIPGIFQVNLRLPAEIEEGRALLVISLDRQTGDQAPIWVRHAVEVDGIRGK